MIVPNGFTFVSHEDEKVLSLYNVDDEFYIVVHGVSEEEFNVSANDLVELAQHLLATASRFVAPAASQAPSVDPMTQLRDVLGQNGFRF